MFDRLNNIKHSMEQKRKIEEAIKRSAEFDKRKYIYQGDIKEDIKNNITNKVFKESLPTLEEPHLANFFVIALFNEIPEDIEQIIKGIKTDIYIRNRHEADVEYCELNKFLAEGNYYPEGHYKRDIYKDLLKEDIIPYTTYIYSAIEFKALKKIVELNSVLVFDDPQFHISGYIKQITKKAYDTCYCKNKEIVKNWNNENKELIHLLMLNLSKDLKVLKDIYLYKSTSLTDYTFKKWEVKRNVLYFEVDATGVWSGYMDRFKDYVEMLIKKYKNIVIDHQCHINDRYFYIYFNPLINNVIYNKYLNVWGQG